MFLSEVPSVYPHASTRRLFFLPLKVPHSLMVSQWHYRQLVSQWLGVVHVPGSVFTEDPDDYYSGGLCGWGSGQQISISTLANLLSLMRWGTFYLCKMKKWVRVSPVPKPNKRTVKTKPLELER